MSAQTILFLYVLFFLLEFLWEQLLTVLNIRTVQRNRFMLPPMFSGYIPEDSYRKSSEYTLVRSRYSILTSAVTSGVLLLLILSGAFGWLDGILSGWGLHPYVHGILFILAVSLLFRLVSLPFALYSQFVIEQRFGFNTMTFRTFVQDQAKGLVVAGILFVPLLLGLFWFMDTAGNLWWVYAFAFIVLFQLIVTVLYPLVIAPLFNKFSPLEEGPLKEKIDALAGRMDFRTKGIFLMDGSKRSKHSNAYFTGFGGAKRIVLFDTLVNSLSEDQILSVLAHEIGHEKKRHIVKRLVLSVLLTGVLFWLLSLLLHYAPLYHAFGFLRPSYHGILVILSFASGPFTFFFTPLFSLWSRKHEYEADRFAVDATGTSKDLKEALIGLGRDNLSNLTPHSLYSFYHYSHPTLSERILAMESYARGHGKHA